MKELKEQYHGVEDENKEDSSYHPEANDKLLSYEIDKNFEMNLDLEMKCNINYIIDYQNQFLNSTFCHHTP